MLKNQEHKTQNTEHRTKNKEQRTKNKEHRTQNTEHRTQNTEHKAQHRTKGSGNRQCGVRGVRSQVQQLIAREKKGRVIVLSTHFMDEADVMADRIGILVCWHSARVLCASSC